MNKVLISWLAPDKDFLGREVNINGPTYSFYKHFYKHDFHILLVPEDLVEYGLTFKQQISDDFPDIIVIPKTREVAWQDPNYQAIKNTMEQALLELRDYQIDILVNTGSDMMRALWFILHYTLGLKTKLLEIREYDSAQPKLQELGFETSSIPISAFIRQQYIDRAEQKDFVLTRSFKKVYDLAYKFAQSENSPILISGPQGIGKQQLARYIHNNSPTRSKRGFFILDCAAYPSQELEYRLIGYKKGAFPGAISDSKGILVEANGGTLYLKNFDHADRKIQKLITKFLEDGIVNPLIGRTKKVNVRLILGVGDDIMSLLRKNILDIDLFYHFALRISMPKLKDLSIDEKREIINRLLEHYAKVFRVKSKLKFCANLWDFFFSYDFPGNFTELKSILESLYITQEKEQVCIEALPEYIKLDEYPNSLALADVEKVHIEKVLKIFKGNKSRSARALGIALNTLKKKIHDYNIDIEKLLKTAGE